MDITEAFRGEDISKTDFFDFVVTPDVGEHQQALHFNRTLKSMGIFIESAAANNSNNNNDLPGNTTYQDTKETNNNHLMMASTTAPSGLPPTEHGMGNFGDHSFWASSSCDKETVRLETAILEDLNKFCWNQDSAEATTPNNNGGPSNKVGVNNSTHNNTDGAIYTLTVLNGGDHNATWYRAPEASTNLKDDDENHQQSLSSPHNIDCQQISFHSNQQNHSSALDLDSILSIIPNQHSTTSTPSSNGHQFHQNGYHHNHAHTSNHLHQTNDSTVTLSPHHHTVNQDGLVKSEQQYAYEDSGYANKDCISHIVDGQSLIQQDASGSDSNTGFSNNNNDWKLANNNNTSTADSLLRSALQGKSFLGRYNGTNPKNAKAMEGHIELRRVLSTPPNGVKTPMENSPVFITNDMADDCSGDQKPSPIMTVTMEGNAVVMFDGGGGPRGLGLTDSDNPSSSQSMDDILLSHLDATSYPEDYEKLKSITNEVVESVTQYCSLDQNSVASPSQLASPGIYISTHLASAENLIPNSMLSSTHQHHHHHHHHQHHANLSPVLTSHSTTKTNIGKKYTKKQSSGASSGSTKVTHSGHQLQSNGVRKERSLHYCSICSKGFKDKYSVNVHIRTHTGEKPFACSLCGKSFRQKAHLAKHYQTHMAQKNAAANTNGVAKPGANKGRYGSAKSS